MLFRRTFFFTAGLVVLSGIAPAQSSKQPESAASTVLFVCEHGAAKSIIAVAHFNDLAKKRGLSVRAVSRGTNPDPVFAPHVVKGLEGEGLPRPEGKPQLVSEGDVRKAGQVVTLGCKLPQKAESTDW